MRAQFGLVLAIALLSGCNTVRGAARDVRYTNANATVRVAYIPVVRVIARSSPFVPEGGGYAVILLRRANPERNARACNIMRQSIGVRVGPADGRPIIMDEMLVNERPVYWPVSRVTRIDCAAMLQNYDFDRAMANLQLLPNSSQLRQGPFIVVRNVHGGPAGLFDFSNVAVEDFDEQFAAVINYMSQRADVWRPEFYEPASFRQRLRYYILDQSGGATTVIAGLFDLKGG